MSFIDEHMQPMEIEDQNEVRPSEVHQQNRFLHQKRLIIVDEKCQAIVPDKPERIVDTFTKHRQSLLFQTDKIANLPNIDDYLLFAQSLVLNQVDEISLEDTKKKNKGFSGDGLILSGLTITQEQVNERALMFLKTMDYSIVKAKFYLLFPTLLVYNQFKHRHSLQFTDEYMNEKIEQYISKLNEDKMMQQNKWKQDLTELINSKQKVHLNQLQQLLDLGQSLKYEVPEQIKHIYQQSMQIQRQLNKLPKEKQTLDKLRQSLEKYEDQIPVITTEIQQLREQVQRSEIFYQKLQKLPIPLDDNQNFEFVFERLINNPSVEKIQLKILANYNQEYKQLPIEIKAFELLHKRLYDFVLDISEKINKFTKIQQTKTRLGQQISNQGEKTEKMTLQQAGLFASQINNVIVSCDDFENFNELYLQALDLNEKAKMQIDDTDIQQRLLGEVLDCPFYLDVQERLQSMIDYSQILESIKQKMSERQHLYANQQIIQLLHRGIINDELKQLQSQSQRVLEWNQLADEILDYRQNVTLIDVYNENFELQQYPNTLTSPPQDIINQLEPQKLQEMNQIGERIKEWKDQLLSLIDCKQFQQQANLRKTNQNKSFNKLWELFKEGLRYKTELSLMNKVRQIILQILDWYAQVYIIKQTLRLNDDISTQIDGIEMICKMFIQKNGTLTTLEQVEKLQKFSSPFVNGSKDLQVIQALTFHTDKWNKEAREALQCQNQEWIKALLEESSKLPVDESLVQELQISHASSLKVNWILSTITSKESLFETILKALENDESIKQLKEDMQNIYLQNPLNKKKKEGIKLSKLAQQFYLNHQNTINSYLAQLNSLDENKLKKIQYVKISKLKDYQKEVQNEDVYQQIEEWTQQFQNWQIQISNLHDQQQQKKKKNKKDTESQSDAYTLTGELLYYFKVPEMLCLVLLGISKNYLSQELISSIEKLVQIYNETQIALSVQSVKEVTNYSEVFMPQFYVMAKKFRVINNWIQMAQEMINDIPRLKNIIMIQKLRPFLDYLNQLQPQDVEKPQPQPQQPQLQTVQSQQSNVKKKMQKSLNKFKVKSQEESQPTQDQESQSVKHSKRVKQVSKLMQDDSIAFYDPNIPLGKAFRQSPNEIMPSDPVMQALKKPIKRSYKRALNRKLPTLVEYEPGSANFLEYLRQQSQELLNLYTSENIYCTCRQGGESAITDFQIIKSLEEKNVEQFYSHHVKLQLQVKYMICCDSCDQWYHYECMGIKKQKEQQDKYICRICLQKNNVPFLILNETLWETHLDGTELYDEYIKQKVQFEKNVLPASGDYIYSNFDLPNFADFKEFVKIGKSLPAQLVELELLELLQQRVEQWITKYENNKQLNLVELIALYAESEWLPIALPETKFLLQLISQKEFLNTANELLQSKATFKSKQLKKSQLEKTEQLFLVIKEQNPELLQDIDYQIIKTIHMLRVQSELNNQLTSQIKQSLTIDQYEQLINQYEKEVKSQIQQSDIKFTLPKLNELKIALTKIQHWDAEIRDMFVDITDIYTPNLSQQYYDSKPNLSDIQVKLKEYELFPIKSPNLCYDFVKALQTKAEEINSLIDSNVQSQSLDDQFELCRTVYKLKCKLPQFKDLLNNVHKEVQLRLIQWLPFIKAGLC